MGNISGNLFRQSRLAVLCLAGMMSPLHAEDIRPEFQMFHDPEIHIPPSERVADPTTVGLWHQALARPETDYQRLAAEEVARSHRDGFPGLAEFKPDLLRIVENPNARPLAIAAAAKALIDLDSREAAESLFRAAQKRGGDHRVDIETALARWKYEPIAPAWRERLKSPEATRRELMLAINGLAELQDRQAVTDLAAIARDGMRPNDIRLAAARAAGRIADTGLDDVASELASRTASPIVNRLCAVGLLRQHASVPAQQLLAKLGADVEPTVAAPALQRLHEIDPALVLPLAEAALANADAHVRHRGVECYLALPTGDRLTRLSRQLNDPHPGVRGRIRNGLYVHAQGDDFAARIRSDAMQVLSEDSWRGQEQAVLLLCTLDYKPAAPRLIELLESQRPEVMIASAWGLRVLAIPETLPAMFDRFRRITAGRQAGTEDVPGIDEQCAHLIEAFGMRHYEEAIPLLREYVPKNFVMGLYSRGAAVWALGHLLEGRPDEALARQLMQRATDLGSITSPPEMDLVRGMSVISIGRMRASSQLAPIRDFLGPTVEPDEIEYAMRWAVEQISGELLPEPMPLIRKQQSGFLIPLRPAE